MTPEMLAALEQLHTSLACAQVRYAERVAAAFDGLTNLVAPYESGHPAVDVLHAVALLVDKAIMAHRAVAVRELDTLLTDLCDGRIADGIALWRHRGGFLGCLQDRQAQPISGSTPWDPLPTVADVLASLQRAAHTLRERRAEEGPKRPSADAVAEEEL